MKLGKGLYIVVLAISLWCSLASAQITCSSGSACQTNFIPVFTSNGGNAKVADSIIQQSGSSVVVGGNLSANGFEIGGNLFAFGSASFQNAFLGFAGNSTNTGTFNLATGPYALSQITTGAYNTAAGAQALGYNTTSSQNTAVGFQALLNNTTGYANTAIGFNAGSGNLSGYYNTFLGTLAGPGFANLSNATAIGGDSVVSESNALILGGTESAAVSVGIGTASPYFDYGLTVTTGGQNGSIDGGVVVDATGGNLYLGMTNGTHKFRVDTNGAVYADGGLFASGADFAESVAVRGKRSEYEPGDVLEIDERADRHLALSSHPYATLVAGIYSTRPGLLASPHHIGDESSKSSEVPLAVVGIVPCKVTAENGPIARGDLLVTSSLPGYAMKGTDRRRLVGAVVGKALEPLSGGKGVIEVLVTLQ
jgi:trimeric autotransporter adhesin